MKLIVAGSRDISIDSITVLNLIDIFVDIHSVDGHELVSGGCPTGPDHAAKGIKQYISVTYKEFPALWEKHGKAAGPIRNKEMADYADALLLIWDGSSKGSANMKKNMMDLGKPVYEVILKRHNVNE